MVITTSAARTTSSVSGFGYALGEIDTDLAHCLDDERVDVLGRCRAGGAYLHSLVGAQPQETGGHLAATRVLNADEEHLRLSLDIVPPWSVSRIVAHGEPGSVWVA